MEAREQGPLPDPGMLGCDREVFAQVWSRVSPGEGSPVELTPEPTRGAEAAPGTRPPSPQGLVCFDGGGRDARQLQELTLECLGGALTYRELTRRSRRARGELLELSRRKTRQAKRLSAACFLMTGVRYWPQASVPAEPPQSFFPVLRERFLAEGRLAGELERLGRAAQDPCLRELYLSLSEETRELVHAIRLIVERET